MLIRFFFVESIILYVSWKLSSLIFLTISIIICPDFNACLTGVADKSVMEQMSIYVHFHTEISTAQYAFQSFPGNFAASRHDFHYRNKALLLINCKVAVFEKNNYVKETSFLQGFAKIIFGSIPQKTNNSTQLNSCE